MLIAANFKYLLQAVSALINVGNLVEVGLDIEVDRHEIMGSIACDYFTTLS